MKRVINVYQHPGILDWCKENEVSWTLLGTTTDISTFTTVIIKVGIEIEDSSPLASMFSLRWV